MTDIAKDLIEKLLKQFDKANGKQVEQEPVIEKVEKVEKKPHRSALVDDWSTMKPLKQHSNTDNKKNMKHVVTVKKNVYDSYSSQIQENPKTRFYITTEKGDTCYMFIVYKTGVDLKPVEGVTYWTVYPSYFENIAWIWKRGMLFLLLLTDDEYLLIVVLFLFVFQLQDLVLTHNVLHMYQKVISFVSNDAVLAYVFSI